MGADAFAAFAARYDAGQAQLVRETLVADCETPVAAFMKLRARASGPAFLLESVEGGAVRGRYSMIGLKPDLIWTCDAGQVTVARPLSAGGAAVRDPDPAFVSLRRVIAESASTIPRSSCRWRPACSAISATTWSG